MEEPDRLESFESPELIYSLSLLDPPCFDPASPLVWLGSLPLTREFTLSTRRPRLSTLSITFVTFSLFLLAALRLLKMPGLKPNLLLKEVEEEVCSLTRLESPLMFLLASFRLLVDSTTWLVNEQLLSTTFFGLLLGGATGPVMGIDL